MTKTIAIAVLLLVAAFAPPAHAAHYRHSAQRAFATDESIVAHPAGCPRVAFCGCGASVDLFGHPVRDLYLAANWLRFPRASAAPGMAAVFGRHHVAIIRTAFGDGTAELYDANSGRGLTRIHRVNISRATIVSPTASGFASADHSRHHDSIAPRYAAQAYGSAVF